MVVTSTDHQKSSLVLVVDDSPDILALVHSLLSDSFQVKNANNGKRGVQIAQSAHLPDRILLDIIMPDMDGYQVCKQLKRTLARATSKSSF
jgi:CheY-like chemotaxis protein